MSPDAPTTVRVGPIDLAHAARRVTTVIGPVAVPTAPVATDRLSRMAAAGSHTRLGLRPQTTGTLWPYRPAEPATVLTADPAPSAEALLTRPAPPLPVDGPAVTVTLAGDYLRTDHRHGLGEVTFTAHLLGVLLGAMDPEDRRQWSPTDRALSGIPTALARTFGTDPRRLVRMAALIGRRRAAPPPDRGAHRAEPAPTPDVVCAVPVISTAAECAALDRWRRRRLPGVSEFAVVAAAVFRALERSGVTLSPRVTVPFDVRRYLPPGRMPLRNFVAGLELEFGPAPDPHAVHGHIVDAARSGRPVANMAMASARIRLAGGVPPPPGPAPGAPTPLLLSAVPSSSLPDGIPWLDHSRTVVLPHSEPLAPGTLTVSICRLHGRMSAVASFHPHRLDAERIRAALGWAVHRTSTLF